MTLNFEPQIYKELNEKDLLFDANAIIKIVDFEANYIIEKLMKEKVALLHTHQVFLELMATDNVSLRTKRQLFLDQYGFGEIPHIETKARAKAVKLQEELHKLDCHPSPTDLYLGACLDTQVTGSTKTFLVTANIKDFPAPIFKKMGFLVLNSDKNVQAFTVVYFSGYGSVMESVKRNEEDIPF